MKASSLASASGTSRDLTQLYKSARQASKKRNRFLHLPTEESGKRALVNGFDGAYELGQLKELPPIWVDTYEKVLEDIRQTEAKSKN